MPGLPDTANRSETELPIGINFSPSYTFKIKKAPQNNSVELFYRECTWARTRDPLLKREMLYH